MRVTVTRIIESGGQSVTKTASAEFDEPIIVDSLQEQQDFSDQLCDYARGHFESFNPPQVTTTNP